MGHSTWEDFLRADVATERARKEKAMADIATLRAERDRLRAERDEAIRERDNLEAACAGLVDVSNTIITAMKFYCDAAYGKDLPDNAPVMTAIKTIVALMESPHD